MQAFGFARHARTLTTAHLLLSSPRNFEQKRDCSRSTPCVTILRECKSHVRHANVRSVTKVKYTNPLPVILHLYTNRSDHSKNRVHFDYILRTETKDMFYVKQFKLDKRTYVVRKIKSAPFRKLVPETNRIIKPTRAVGKDMTLVL